MNGFDGINEQYPQKWDSKNSKGPSPRPDNIGYHGEDALASGSEGVVTSDGYPHWDSSNKANKAGQIPDPTLINRGYTDNDQGNFTTKSPSANRQKLGARNSINKGQ